MKRIVIIGASSGIGLKTALRFARMGWHVGVAARRTDNLRALKNQYRQQVEYAGIDITDDDTPERILELIKRLGGMDVMLDCAGTGWSNPQLDIAKETATVRTNVEGFIRVVDTAYRYFADNKIGGQIATITSVAGTKGIGISAAYSASKRFESTYLEALSQLTAVDGTGIRITDIRPGFIRTALLDPSRDYPMLMDVDYAADRVVRAITGRKHVAYIDWRWGLLTRAWSLIPSIIWRKLKINL